MEIQVLKVVQKHVVRFVTYPIASQQPAATTQDTPPRSIRMRGDKGGPKYVFAIFWLVQPKDFFKKKIFLYDPKIIKITFFDLRYS